MPTNTSPQHDGRSLPRLSEPSKYFMMRFNAIDLSWSHYLGQRLTAKVTVTHVASTMRKSRSSRSFLAQCLQPFLNLTFASITSAQKITTQNKHQPKSHYNHGTTPSVTREEATDTEQAPKTNCTPAKLTAALTYMQKSRVAHTLKDLEKHLPSVAQINGMQVKGIGSPYSRAGRPHLLTIDCRLRARSPR